jgi:glucose/arabinose dehydrogenase
LCAGEQVRRATLCFALVAAVAGCGGCDDGDDGNSRSSTPSAIETGSAGSGERELVRASGGPRVETIATGLVAPWEIAFLPDGRALVTELEGRVRLLESDLTLREEPIAELEVAAAGEGGLLGVAVDPQFERNRLVYLYRTMADDENRVTRYRLEGDALAGETVIAEGIAAEAFHDGGRLHFGPDAGLYFSAGDAGRKRLAQDRSSLNGKLLRLAPRQYRGEGGRPQVVSFGHRNPQGFDWQPRSGLLVATEHGDVGNDEINLIREGRNYGWPRVQGEDHRQFESPIALFREAIAPSGATFVSLPGSEWSGDFLVGCLVGEQIRQLRFDESGRVVVNKALLAGEFGRLRTVVEGPDGALYALTSNVYRGTTREGDDKILRIVPPAE